MSSSTDQSFDPQVLRRILVALLDTRDLMSIQLTYAERVCYKVAEVEAFSLSSES